MKPVFLTFFVLVMTAAPTRAVDLGRVVKQLRLPNGAATLVVAEGDFEPRSVGSYTLRIYSSKNPDFPFDDFIVGVVRPREGAVKEVRFADLESDGSNEIVVVVQSVGTGGNLSADAFRFHLNRLTLVASVSGLDPRKDPIEALKTKVKANDMHRAFSGHGGH